MLFPWFTALVLPPLAIKPLRQRMPHLARAPLTVMLSGWAAYLFFWIYPNLIGITPGVYCCWLLLIASVMACGMIAHLARDDATIAVPPAVLVALGSCVAGIVLVVQVHNRDYLASRWIEIPLPPARPEVLDYRLEARVFGDNLLKVKIRNGGQAGWVMISNVATITTTELEYEPGAITWFRNMFTKDPSLGFNAKTSSREAGRWEVCTWIAAGETKWLRFALRGHDSSSHNGPTVVGVHKPPQGAVMK
jgi:hypothetical protein